MEILGLSLTVGSGGLLVFGIYLLARRRLWLGSGLAACGAYWLAAFLLPTSLLPLSRPAQLRVLVRLERDTVVLLLSGLTLVVVNIAWSRMERKAAAALVAILVLVNGLLGISLVVRSSLFTPPVGMKGVIVGVSIGLLALGIAWSARVRHSRRAGAQSPGDAPRTG